MAGSRGRQEDRPIKVKEDTDMTTKNPLLTVTAAEDDVRPRLMRRIP